MRCGVVGLGALGVASRRCGRVEILEEGEGGGCDVEVAESIELVESVVELFGCCEGGEVPVTCCVCGLELMCVGETSSV